MAASKTPKPKRKASSAAEPHEFVGIRYAFKGARVVAVGARRDEAVGTAISHLALHEGVVPVIVWQGDEIVAVVANDSRGVQSYRLVPMPHPWADAEDEDEPQKKRS